LRKKQNRGECKLKEKKKSWAHCDGVQLSWGVKKAARNLRDRRHGYPGPEQETRRHDEGVTKIRESKGAGLDEDEGPWEGIAALG